MCAGGNNNIGSKAGDEEKGRVLKTKYGLFETLVMFFGLYYIAEHLSDHDESHFP